MFELLYTREAKKGIDGLNKKIKIKVKQALEKLSSQSTLGKALTAELKGKFSYRVGKYRIIYTIFHKDKKIIILAVGHRREVYK